MLGAFIMTVILRQYWLRLGMWYLEVQPGIDCLLTGGNDCNKHWRHQLKQTDEYSPSRRCLWHSEVWGNQSHKLALVSLSASGLPSGCWSPLGCSLQRPEVPGDGITWALLTSAERCGRVNTPAPLSSDWDNSGVTYTISKAPLWKGPQVPLYMRVLDTQSHLASFSSLSTLPTLYGFFCFSFLESS